jgi:SAM-dependent methyltransferase
MPAELQTCRICGAATLEDIPEFRLLPRVTSDCVPFRAGGRLRICRGCGAAQSPADQQWFEEIEEIYRSYSAYHQAGGMEQRVLDPTTGRLTQRSRVLVNNLLALDGVAQSGKVLDVGCGTGATLRAFSEGGDWRLFGLELDDRNLQRLTSINNFDMLYTCAPADLPGQFTIVTMVHALEHFPEPMKTLRSLHSKIVSEGRLFVEVPDADANPFDYVIADHMLHFNPRTLSTLIARAGFAVDCLATSWVAKELSLTAHPAYANTAASPSGDSTEILARTRAQIGWLTRFLETAHAATASNGKFGLFGSSIAATWLCSFLGDRVSFFVEEDPNRVGRTHMHRPIISPAETPPGSVVYLALIPQIASRVAERLGDIMTFHLPPPLAI